MNAPHRNEYESAYLEKYISLVLDENAIKTMENLLISTQKLLQSITEEKGNYQYAEGKWSIKEIMGHIIDTERIFAYRALCIARGDKTSFPGYEQDDYVLAGQFDQRSLSDICNEYRAVREANLALYKSLSTERLSTKGLANGKYITPRVLAYATAGHEVHHIKVIQEKYL